MSSSAWVVTSPITTHRPLVMAVSQATRAWGSWASMPSRTASETWSQTLSGCPSVTDSDVRRNDFDALKEVVTTAANHTRGGLPALQRGKGGRACPGRDFVFNSPNVVGLQTFD